MDDAHRFKEPGNPDVAGPGRGWVAVRAPRLEARALLDALERGEFYASTGVELTDYQASTRQITVTVKATLFSKYRIQFIGKGGRVLREATEPTATYEIRGDEGYVRARVLESNGRMAWCQPLIVSPRGSARGGPAGLWLMVMLSVGIWGWKYGSINLERRVSVMVDGRLWTEVRSLDEAGPDDEAFLIDVTTGVVVFGDGRHGRRPPAGAAITETYRAGSGEVTEQFAGAKRVHYYNGQRLTAADFNQEQDYHLQKRRLHNKMLHGTGVVSGLRVTVETSCPPVIVVEAGLALDPSGREVILTAPVELVIREECLPQYVVVEYTARETDWVTGPDDKHRRRGLGLKTGRSFVSLPIRRPNRA